MLANRRGAIPEVLGANEAEVEPWLEVNPENADNVVTFYQQDRYSDGGAKGNVAAVSFAGVGVVAGVRLARRGRRPSPCRLLSSD